jgi:hypothetical protein
MSSIILPAILPIIPYIILPIIPWTIFPITLPIIR